MKMMEGGLKDPFLDLERATLAEDILEEHFRVSPHLRQMYSKEQIERCREDIGYHLDFLRMSVLTDSRIIFANYLKWLKGLFSSLGLDEEMMVINFRVMKEIISLKLDGDDSASIELLDMAINEYPGYPDDVERHIPEGGPHAPIANQYLNLLLEGERHQAMELIIKMVESRVPVKEIYLDVFEKVQKEIGALWQMNRITVAQEHYMTASTQLIMARLYPHIFNSKRKNRKMIATCAQGELHEIGIRMVADFFEMEGWGTYYLGANTPMESLIRTVEDTKPDLLAISSTIPTHVERVKEMIERIKGSLGEQAPKIIVGGYPFNTDLTLWKKIGSDGYARNAIDAVETARILME
jgi:methanogenic corrinoid protein MtbC1